jgi:hypothetical protein
VTGNTWHFLVRHPGRIGRRRRNKKRSRSAVPRRLAIETLEERRLLATFTVNRLVDLPVANAGDAPGTLRQAIFDANSAPGADTIQFSAGLSGTINLSIVGDATLGPSSLLVNSAIVIRGNAAGITIGRDATAVDMRLFRVTSAGSLRLESISLTGGTARGPDDAEARGGAIYNNGTLEIVASTLDANRAIGGDAATGNYGQRGYGGAIFNDEGSVLLENATLSGNQALSGTGPTVLASFGGGVYSRNGSLSVYNSTITNSTSGTGRGVYVLAEGALSTATVEIYSSIIAQADAPVLQRDLVVAEDAGGAASVSGSGNLIRTHNTYAAITIPDPDDPLLAELSNNGGPTRTHALGAESQAIDEGANPRSLANDQRGAAFDRVVGTRADIGAFELQTVNSPALPGDYNGNHRVDAADYVIWRKTLDSDVVKFTGADGSGDGTVDFADYGVWQGRYGAAASTASAAIAAVADGAAAHASAVERNIVLAADAQVIFPSARDVRQPTLAGRKLVPLHPQRGVDADLLEILAVATAAMVPTEETPYFGLPPDSAVNDASAETADTRLLAGIWADWERSWALCPSWDELLAVAR